ncbi:allophanate hydrolase [Azohydromonas aeria]|uniref:allophanate hydrolase n=1 Tax=Azohydromonas aeria TaxID=2590212 RepID=UPI0012FACFDE|nr:allophanate hydrolase [Azohydromonas aeria]
MTTTRPWTIAACLEALHGGALTPARLVEKVRARLSADDPAWITLCDDAFVAAQLARLEALEPSLPLYGVPFAVKDNIDVAGLPTTAACPAFTYVPTRHAGCVQRLLDAGAVLVGKTNLDQFATGLVGTRSPYGEVPNSFDQAYVSGGSSSGSASVVARGLVPFALGTDTAGSGRVPAGFNNLVGLKPTPGAVGMRGVLPACRTLDTVSVFALTAADAARVLALIEGPDEGAAFHAAVPRPPWFAAPLRVGVPLVPDCDAALGYDRAFAAAVARLEPALQARAVPVDMRPFFEVAQLLYEGPWVAERHVVAGALLAEAPQALDPVVRGVIAAAAGFDAADAFRARYRLAELARAIEPLWRDIDVLMVPTAPTLPTRAAVAAEPVLRNSELGRYTNFVNLLGLAAIALPASITPQRLPFGVTFIAPGGSDAALAALGARWQSGLDLPLGAQLGAPTPADLAPARLPAAAPTLALAVVGAHLQGMPLHGQLVERGCRLRERTRTTARYRLHALPGSVPAKPGLQRVAQGGVGIEVEVYDMPRAEVGGFLALIPPPLGLGSVELESGEWVHGFICEPLALADAEDVSAFGGWRAYLQDKARVADDAR